VERRQLKRKTAKKSDAVRSQTMRAVKSADTKPEQTVKLLLEQLGLRFDRHVGTLPGKPDFVLAAQRKVIFVHGCFWHGHSCPRGQRQPATNTEYWHQKIARNRQRDRKVRSELRRQGWRVLFVWECRLRHRGRVTASIKRFIAAPR